MFIYLAWHKVSLTLSYQYNQAQGSENNFKTLYFVQASGWSIHQFKHPILLPYNNCFTWSRQCHILQTILNKVLCILCLTAIYYGQFQFFVWKRNQLQNVLFFFSPSSFFVYLFHTWFLFTTRSTMSIHAKSWKWMMLEIAKHP